MENARLLTAIIETAIDGIITIDQRGLIEGLNPIKVPTTAIWSITNIPAKSISLVPAGKSGGCVKMDLPFPSDWR